MIAVLTIAAGDSSGCAGIPQDLRVFDRLGVWGLSASTGDTIQNPQGVIETRPSDPEFFRRQLVSALDSFPVAAVKTGAFLSPTHVVIAAETLRARLASRRSEGVAPIPLVCDPVFAPTTGAPFLDAEGIRAYADALLPLASVVTPNLDECATLRVLRAPPWSSTDGEFRALYLKDGHGTNPTTLTETLVLPDGSTRVIKKKRRSWAYSRGTGCAFSAAVAAFLTKGHGLADSCARAARWVDRYYASLNERFTAPCRASARVTGRAQ